MENAYLACYDISSNRLRTKCAALLEKYGQRIQKSVFLLSLSRLTLEKLQRSVEKLLEEEDSFFFFPICAACFERLQAIGRYSQAAVVL